MKTTLKLLGAFLALDVLFLIGASYYSLGYEEALRAWLYGALFGLPVLGSFVTLLVLHRRRQKNSRF